jgi:hypothetical protein
VTPRAISGTTMSVHTPGEKGLHKAGHGGELAGHLGRVPGQDTISTKNQF